MSNQVVTIGYLKSFVKGFLTVTTSQLDSYCPTYNELTNGSIVKKFIYNDLPLSVTNGVYVNPQFTNGVNYGPNQLVKREHLMVKFVELVSILTVANKNNLSCCGDNATLTTTASFDYKTKNESGIVIDRKGITQNVSPSYTESVSYASINGNVVNVSKNAVNYPNNASSRTFIVSSSYNYVFGGQKTSSVSISQNSNTIGNWINTTQDTTSITIKPTSFNFTINGGNISYVTTRVYTQNMKKVDSCNVTVATNSVPNNTMTVTPTSFTSNNPEFTVTANQVSVAKQGNSSAEKKAIITISYDGKSVTANANQPATSISGWEKEGERYSFTLSVQLSPSGSLPCTGGTTNATATYGWKQNYVKKDSFGVVVEREIRYESSDVTSSTNWTTTRGSVNPNGVVIYPKSDSTSTITTTVTGKYSGLSAHASFTQENCVQCHNEYTYDMKVLPVSIGCCETSASPVVQGRKHTQYVCTDGTSEDKGWTNFTNLLSNEYSITISPSISSNETSSVKTYKIIASGQGVYNGLSATSTVTQAAGPCTTYVCEVEVNENISYTKLVNKCATPKDIVFPTMKGRYKVCKNGVCGSFSAWENLKEGTDYNWVDKYNCFSENETNKERYVTLTFNGKGKYNGVDHFVSLTQEAGPCHPTCTEGWYLVKEDKQNPILTIYDSPKITIPAIGVDNNNPVKLNGGKLNQTINRNYEWRNSDCSLNKQKTSATTENVLLKEYANSEINYTSHNILLVTPKDGYIVFCSENEYTYKLNHTLTGSVTYNGVTYQDTTIINQEAATESWVTNVDPTTLTFSKKNETKYVTVNWQRKINGTVVETIYPESYWFEDPTNISQLSVQYVDSSTGKFSVKFGNPEANEEPWINFCKPGHSKPTKDASVQCYFTGQYCPESWDYSSATLSFDCDSSMAYNQTNANVRNVKLSNVRYTDNACVVYVITVDLSGSQYSVSYNPSGTNPNTYDRTVTVTVKSDSSHGSKSASKSITQRHKTCTVSKDYSSAYLTFNASVMGWSDTTSSIDNVFIDGIERTNSDCTISNMTEYISVSDCTVSYSPSGQNTGENSRPVTITLKTNSKYGGYTISGTKKVTQYGRTCTPSYDYSSATLSFDCDSSMAYNQTSANVRNVTLNNVIYTNSNCVTSTTYVALSSSQYSVSYNPSGTNNGTTDRSVTVTVTSDSSHGSKSASKSITQGHKTCTPSYDYSSATLSFNCDSSMTYDQTDAHIKNVKMTNVVYTDSNCKETSTEVALSSSQYSVSYNPSGTNNGTTDRSVTVTVTSDSSHGNMTLSKTIKQNGKPIVLQANPATIDHTLHGTNGFKSLLLSTEQPVNNDVTYTFTCKDAETNKQYTEEVKLVKGSKKIEHTTPNSICPYDYTLVKVTPSKDDKYDYSNVTINEQKEFSMVFSLYTYGNFDVKGSSFFKINNLIIEKNGVNIVQSLVDKFNSQINDVYGPKIEYYPNFENSILIKRTDRVSLVESMKIGDTFTFKADENNCYFAFHDAPSLALEKGRFVIYPMATKYTPCKFNSRMDEPVVSFEQVSPIYAGGGVGRLSYSFWDNSFSVGQTIKVNLSFQDRYNGKYYAPSRMFYNLNIISLTKLNVGGNESLENYEIKILRKPTSQELGDKNFIQITTLYADGNSVYYGYNQIIIS